MIRRSLLLLVGAVLAGPLACAGSDPAPPPPSPSAARMPLPPPVAMRPLPPRAGSGPTFASPPPSQAVRDRAAIAEACRRDADRVVLYRDRGQLMREDERDARVGTDASIYARRAETDRLGRGFERDRLAAECLEQGTSAPSPPR
jgi:hypothetical protein